MRLIANWREVIRHALSVRWIAAAFLLTVAEVVLPYLDLPIPERTFAVLSGLTIGGAFVARLLAQRHL